MPTFVRLRRPFGVILVFVSGLLASVVAQQTSSLRITVIDNFGAAVPNAEVRIVELPSVIGIPSPNGTFSFKGVSAGAYQVSIKYPGFKDKIVDGVLVEDGKTTAITVRLEQGPPKASDFRLQQELSNPRAYSKALADIGQPPLCEDSPSDSEERYRFIWVPTFTRPIFLRVDIKPDGTATLLTYVWKGAGGYEWGKPVRNLRKLSFVEQSDLFATLADIGFWTLPAQVEDPPNKVVLDGTDWFIEGAKSGQCHVVTRYSTPLTDVFSTQFLSNIAKIKPYQPRQ
jgi:hypothetical protein